MKKIVVLTFLMSGLSAMSQFTIEGKVKRLSLISDSINLNIPFIYGYHKENNHYIKINKDGSFRFSFNLKKEKFATLEWGNQSYSLFIQPGKSLVINIDSLSGQIISFKGSAGVNNKLLNQLGFTEIPFFNKGGQADGNGYSKLTLASIPEKVIAPWSKERDAKRTLIETSKIDDRLKKLFIAELNYLYYNQLNYYSRGIVRLPRKELMSFFVSTTDTLSPNPVVPSPGPQYYFFAENYIGYLEAKSFMVYQEKKLSNTDALPYYGFSIDSGNALVKQKGKSFMNWVAVRNNFKDAFGEAFLVQNITNHYQYKDLKQFNSLLNEFELHYSKNQYLASLQQKRIHLISLLEQESKNKEIIVYEGYEKLISIYEVVQKYKGKVVYLDIWGTWCGPCKEELKFLPELKKKFKDKDVVFLYLDMDDDYKDKEWRDFIAVNSLTGIHLRKNNKEIQSVWEELLPNDKEKHGRYPTYFIFNKSGKLVVPEAKRPSDQLELYQQLERFLQ